MRVSGFPYGPPAVLLRAASAIGDSPSQGNLGRRDYTRINAIPHGSYDETRLSRGPTDKDCGLFKEDTSVLGHWPHSRLDQSKDAAQKKPKYLESQLPRLAKAKRNIWRLLLIHGLSCAHAGARSARALLQRKHRGKIREATCHFSQQKNTHPPPFPPHSPSQGNLGRRDYTRINAIPHDSYDETRLFRGPTDKDDYRSVDTGNQEPTYGTFHFFSTG